ncbi:MAG: MBL fold metallo-hydrolase, partial [Polaromonas sp.]
AARTLMHSGLRHLVAAHLSAHNNCPLLVQTLMAEALSCRADDIIVASPDSGTGWLQA